MDSGTGTGNVAYNQAGNINYNSAAPVTAATTALKAIQVIAVTASAPHSHLTEAPSLSPLRVGRQVSRSRSLHRLLMAARIQDRVSPLPVALSRAKSCTTSWGIPVKWRLTLNGVPVSSLASFVGLFSYDVSCSTGTGDIEAAIEEYAPSASGLIYDGDGNFHFNWKTASQYKNACRVMYLSFSDGSVSKLV